jgi:hypothetical protein
MTSLTAVRKRLRLGSQRAALAGAALCAFVGCSAGNANPNTSNPNTGNGGTGSASGGSSGTATSGGTAASMAGSTASGGTGNGTSGGGSAQGGSVGSAGSGGATTLMLGNSGGKYSLTFGQTYLEIDPANGARITALRVGGATGMDVILPQAVTPAPRTPTIGARRFGRRRKLGHGRRRARTASLPSTRRRTRRRWTPHRSR